VDRPWFQLSFDEITALPVDELGLRILEQMGDGSETRNNAVIRLNRAEDVPREAKQAVTEAWWWLMRKGLIAPDAQNTDDTWWLATRLGRDVVERENGLERLRAGERLDIELHPRIAVDVRSEFLRGKFEAAVWVAMREVEVALREVSHADPYAYGPGLLRHAFDQKEGVLNDRELPEAEQQAIANLFRGALGALKNPHSHRKIRFDDPVEAAELVIFASLLLRILDRLGEASRLEQDER
jgi:uncharacterized protein (TIGR02391 family)